MPRTIFENIVIQHFKEVTSIAFCKYMPIRFFEILFIEKGQGTLIINDHRVPYGDNQIFILIPNDKYNFEIQAPTTVSAIKFLNSFFGNFSSDQDQTQRKEWFKKIETILCSTNRTSDINLHSEIEENNIHDLFSVLCNEYNHSNLRDEVILKNTLHSILQIISRNISYTSSKTGTSKIQKIIDFIHYNIYDSEQISNKGIATKFNVSENYIGQYFKKEMGISLKKYILNHKIKLAETRLKYTDLTLTEIAFELGFTDSSHLDKTFISYKGTTPSSYRSAHKIAVSNPTS
ncbi:AraC family transcriptional regulator [Tenacibaculum agarivorans]|uniref:AraC family transcriptional regulator n=1 Tax=Tenacibaculum agarivorans TaxID=1908389 RepID=UPI00094BBE7C|nr:AraC family transcriptional regulator [Tenacibaculum agarivorans]